MPRIRQVFVPKNTLKFFATERGAEAFARKECQSINAKWEGCEAGPALLELNGKRATAKDCFFGVAVLRPDQDWMTPHLRERGLSVRILNSTKGEKT